MLVPIKGNFKNKDIVSLNQFDQKSIKILFKQTAKIKKTNPKKLLKILRGKVAGLLFFEPSTRTFSSNSAAFKRLGGQTVEHQNPLQTSSVVKGETVEDTAKIMEQYCDILVIRHPIKGTLSKVSEVVSIPVINAGDGIGEHPTQALLDMFTIYEKHRHLDHLNGLMVGDMLNGRTVHSLIRGLSIFPGNTIYLLSPNQLRLSKEEFEHYTKMGIKLIEINSLKEIPPDCHFWYWTRVQKERFSNKKIYEKLKLSFILTKKLVEEKGSEKTLLMHPLPRVGEIETSVDSDPRAVYLTTEAKNGMYIRMALFKLILNFFNFKFSLKLNIENSLKISN
ncbi:aspartate carbamoyltransferase [Candidatus Roizmanbacteria bacterium CG_4_8_14_3_um_filter_36_10]|uniref:Aspartate carbamoyltransferase n=4 Tax=Candidatus Roizmaniibacteriota TaxID=1752723 RepID=A0A2M7E4B9_9BACT|nr:aspartate carbamoyltransferase [Candidatus Roizmanbacteria bacterium]PIP64133.1 MAG: aspartate carbamoyltransferase [Candidatus Roizmanbacteria bacterium CG22_combo_CG10-13_8_21_14_all_33_16]PIV62572.1 MAG: aspartate carbamoyltransferase [Candidatus Roizmanbacteria bacterium CG01_land_8_20_14_3_00_33_9]PIX71262.1 MAG: aspartate carbamoyltransferase [Candidatus Roizmanbacteria bacterium CG_4_10_14_3_um_filter_33_21]PJC81957.1 MAG: aspartate carbamoyltransferase [Candidatus Roizmanbacteria bac